MTPSLSRPGPGVRVRAAHSSGSGTPPWVSAGPHREQGLDPGGLALYIRIEGLNLSTTAPSRRDDRHSVSPSLNGRVEFEFPAGRRWRLDLVDLSVAGLAFALDNGCPQMECGSRLSEVVVHVADAEIPGDLLILHVTRDAERRTICGALFHPATEKAVNRLRQAIESVAG